MNIYDQIRLEVERSRTKFPQWPDDYVTACAIVCEECGEAIRAALQHKYEAGLVDSIREELIQTAATCIRALEET